MQTEMIFGRMTRATLEVLDVKSIFDLPSSFFYWSREMKYTFIFNTKIFSSTSLKVMIPFYIFFVNTCFGASRKNK